MNKNTVPDWKLERYLLGELPAAEIQEITARVADDEALRFRIESLRRSNADLLEKYPPAWMARKMTKPNRSRLQMTSLPKWFAPALLAAAALVMVPMLLVSQPGQTEQFTLVDENGTRIKGLSPRIEIWRKQGDQAERLDSNDHARAGDLIQVRYAVPNRCFGAVMSVDGRGVLTVHLADMSHSATLLEPGKLVALERSYQLDDAPQFETFFLVTSAHDFDLAPVARALLDAVQDPGKPAPQLPRGQSAIAFKLPKGE